MIRVYVFHIRHTHHLTPVLPAFFLTMADADVTFESTSSGASATVPAQCSSIKKGGHAVMKGKPCKVVETRYDEMGG